MSDDPESGKNELAEVIEKRNRKYHRVMQKGARNCCKLQCKKNGKLNYKLYENIFKNELVTV